MMLVCLRRAVASTSIAKSHFLSCYFRSKSSYPLSRPSIVKSEQSCYPLTSADDSKGSGSHLKGTYSLHLLSQDQTQLDSHEINVVDLDTWSVSSGLACVSKSKQKESQLRLFGIEEVDDQLVNNTKVVKDCDFDDIEDMRNHGNLFYKIERRSIEFEEYKFDFHGKKSKSNANDEKESKKKETLKCDLDQNGQNSVKSKVFQQASRKSDLKEGTLVNKERLARTLEEKFVVCTENLDASVKKQRNPTFNQLTGPYHEPFCLDIYVSKGSVRACVVHRVTSKVVVVAHSISKDIKSNLGSTKSRVAAATVGKVLAQRALADDIHDVIYTPRKGEKLEGKLHVVLQAIMDNGVKVKVRFKQRNPSKAVRRLPQDEE